jgi:hypothetical protein
MVTHMAYGPNDMIMIMTDGIASGIANTRQGAQRQKSEVKADIMADSWSLAVESIGRSHVCSNGYGLYGFFSFRGGYTHAFGIGGHTDTPRGSKGLGDSLTPSDKNSESLMC